MVSPGEFLQIVINGSAYKWLGPLSTLIATLDDVLDSIDDKDATPDTRIDMGAHVRREGLQRRFQSPISADAANQSRGCDSQWPRGTASAGRDAHAHARRKGLSIDRWLAGRAEGVCLSLCLPAGSFR